MDDRDGGVGRSPGEEEVRLDEHTDRQRTEEGESEGSVHSGCEVAQLATGEVPRHLNARKAKGGERKVRLSQAAEGRTSGVLPTRRAFVKRLISF